MRGSRLNRFPPADIGDWLPELVPNCSAAARTWSESSHAVAHLRQAAIAPGGMGRASILFPAWCVNRSPGERIAGFERRGYRSGDKVEHFTAHAVLAALPNLPSFRCRRIGAAMVFLFLLGAALELGQIFSPGRTCDWRDLLANVCGILAGLALVRILALDPQVWQPYREETGVEVNVPTCRTSPRSGARTNTASRCGMLLSACGGGKASHLGKATKPDISR
jgi:uncharacterized protein YfiM (DUF2279 family)